MTVLPLGVILVVALFVLVSVTAIAATPVSGSATTSSVVSAAEVQPDSSLIYYNGTINGNGGTQTTYIPSPSNGTVWDLISARITIRAPDGVSSLQNSYLYDSVCTQADVSPAPSACEGIYGPNVNGWANDLIESGGSGTVVGEGGYASSTPPGVSYYTHFKQTIHLTYDIFVSFGAELSSGVSSNYTIIFEAESGDYPSYAFYQYSHPVEPLSSTPTTVTIPGPPNGYVYRVEIAWTTIEFGSGLGPYRLAELLEEPSGFVLAKINNWTSGYSGASACGGYSAQQTCISDNGVGTETVYDDQVLLSSSDSFKAEFVGVSGDEGDYGIVVTEYPASTFVYPPAPTGLAGAPTANTIVWTWTQSTGGGILNNTVYLYSGASCSGAAVGYGSDTAVVSLATGSLDEGAPYSAEVTSWNETGQSDPSSCASATTLTGGGSTYTLTFTETGLSKGTDWSVTVAGAKGSSTTTVVSFSVGTGTYSYSVGAVSGYSVSPSSGTVTISGASKNVALTFTASSSGKSGTTTTSAAVDWLTTNTVLIAVVFIEIVGFLALAVSRHPLFGFFVIVAGVAVAVVGFHAVGWPSYSLSGTLRVGEVLRWST